MKRETKRTQTVEAPCRDEIDDLRRRLVRIEAEMARREDAETVVLLVKRILAACHDWVVDGSEPVLDPEQVRRSTSRRMAGLAEALRAEIVRQGLGPGELDVRLGWPEGRTEHVLTVPSDFGEAEARSLCRELGTSMEGMLRMTEGGYP